jgi:hypothetical protein
MLVGETPVLNSTNGLLDEGEADGIRLVNVKKNNTSRRKTRGRTFFGRVDSRNISTFGMVIPKAGIETRFGSA